MKPAMFLDCMIFVATQTSGNMIPVSQGLEAPAVVIRPSATQKVRTVRNALFECHVTRGNPPPKVRWMLYSRQSFPSNVKKLESGRLRFQSVTQNNGGKYVCCAENEMGDSCAVAKLIVV